MSWSGASAGKDVQQLNAEINGLRAYKINADAAIRKLRNKEKTLVTRLKQQEKELNARDDKLRAAARRIRTLAAPAAKKGASAGGDNQMLDDMKRLVDENLKLKKHLEDTKEEYHIRRKALETNLQHLAAENDKLKDAAASAAPPSSTSNSRPGGNDNKASSTETSAGSNGEDATNAEARLKEEQARRKELEEKYRALDKDFTRMVTKLQEEGQTALRLRDELEGQRQKARESEKALKVAQQQAAAAAAAAATQTGSSGGTDRDEAALSALREENEKLKKEKQMLMWERVDLKSALDASKKKKKKKNEVGSNGDTATSDPSDEGTGEADDDAADGADEGGESKRHIEELRMQLISREKTIKELKASEMEQRQKVAQLIASAKRTTGVSSSSSSSSSSSTASSNEKKYRMRLAQSQDQLLKMRNAYAALKAQQDEMKRILVEKDNIIESLGAKEEEDDTEAKLGALKKQYMQITESFASAQSSLIDSKAEVETLKEERQNVKKTSERVEKELARLKLDSRSKISGLEESLQSTRQGLAEAEEKLKGTSQELTECRSRLEKLSAQASDSNKENSDIKTSLEAETTRADQAEKQLQKTRIELEGATETNKEHATKISSLESQVEELQLNHKIILKKNANLTRDLKRNLKRDAVKATETKAELLEERDRRLSLEAKLKKADQRLLAMQKRLLVASTFPQGGGNQGGEQDLFSSQSAKHVLQGVTQLLEKTMRRLLELPPSSTSASLLPPSLGPSFLQAAAAAPPVPPPTSSAAAASSSSTPSPYSAQAASIVLPPNDGSGEAGSGPVAAGDTAIPVQLSDVPLSDDDGDEDTKKGGEGASAAATAGGGGAGAETKVAQSLGGHLPPPIPVAPKPNTPQGEFLDAVARRYEESMQTAHALQERVKYLQESMRLVNEDCEKKRLIIQTFLLETARDPGKDFQSKFGGTPEQLRDLLLHRMEIVLQDAIVQNIRLRNQVSQMLSTNATLRQQDKKSKQMILKCKHVILKLREEIHGAAGSLRSAPGSSIAVAKKNDIVDKKKGPDDTANSAVAAEPEVLDAAHALDLGELLSTDSKKEQQETPSAAPQLLDTMMPTVNTSDKSRHPRSSSSSSSSSRPQPSEPVNTQNGESKHDAPTTMTTNVSDGVVQGGQDSPEVFDAASEVLDVPTSDDNISRGDDGEDDDGPEVADIPLPPKDE